MHRDGVSRVPCPSSDPHGIAIFHGTSPRHERDRPETNRRRHDLGAVQRHGVLMESLNRSAPGGRIGDVSRRDVLELAAGLGLSFLAPFLELRAARARGAERPKSLIILWMDGGQSQLESWDPHPGRKIGGDTKAIRTRLPGVEIATSFPRMAEQ